MAHPPADRAPRATRRRVRGGPARLGIVAILWLAACTASPSSPTPGPPLSEAALRQTLVETLGPLWYCDPDVFPIQREDELASALARWPEVVGDADAFAVLTAALGIDPSVALDDGAKLAVYRAWKALRAIRLEPAVDGRRRFEYLAQPVGGANEGLRTVGTIAADGTLTVEQQVPAGEPICPICLAVGTAIDTPDGSRPVERLTVGDPVWTLDRSGRRIRGVVLATGSTEAPMGHEVVRLELADGVSLEASPGHPLADGRLVGAIDVDDRIGGRVVRRVDRVPYDGATHDLVVSGPTGVYLSHGVPLASTLAPATAAPAGAAPPPSPYP